MPVPILGSIFVLTIVHLTRNYCTLASAVVENSELRRGLARVSSKEQAQSNALDNQIARLKAAGCEKIYCDIESGFKKGRSRSGFDSLMQDVEAHDEVAVTNLDRLSRQEVVSFMVFDQFEEKNVTLLSLDQPYLDLTNPDGRLLAGYSVLEARAYSARLSRRVKMGHKAHRDRNGAYVAPFGYRKVGESLVLNHDPFLCLLEDHKELSRAAIGRDLIEIFFKCRSMRQALATINQKYGITTHNRTGGGNKQPRGKFHFCPSGFAAWLNNPILRGHTCYGRSRRQRQCHKHLWDIRYNTHPNDKLMSEAEYREIEDILAHNARSGGYAFKSKVIHPLSGLIYCGECGGKCRAIAYRLRSDKSKKIYSYQCYNYHIHGCPQKKSIKEQVLENSLVDRLVTRAEGISQIAMSSDEIVESPQLVQLRSQLAGLEALGENPAFESAKIALKSQIQELLSRTSQDLTSANSMRELLLTHFSNPSFWRTLPSIDKQLVYRKLVSKIIIRDGEILEVILNV